MIRDGNDGASDEKEIEATDFKGPKEAHLLVAQCRHKRKAN